MSRNSLIVVGLLCFQAMLAVVVVAKPEALGINPIVLNWLAIFNVGVGAGLNQLKALGGGEHHTETETTTVAVPGRAPVVQTVVTEQQTGKAEPPDDRQQ